MKNRVVISHNIKDLNLPTRYALWRKYILQDQVLAQKISLNYFICDLQRLGILNLVRYRTSLGKFGCRIEKPNEFANRIESYRKESHLKILVYGILYRLKGQYENL